MRLEPRKGAWCRQRLRPFAVLQLDWINSNLHNMRMGNRSTRTWIAIAVALVFALAAMPGSMAMPAPKPASPASHVMMPQMAMADCCGQQSDHMKPEKQQNKPCKDMAVCFGLLSCYGLAALPVAYHAVAKVAAGNAPLALNQAVSGQTVPPDDPPPIA